MGGFFAIYQGVGFCGIDLMEWRVNELLTDSHWDSKLRDIHAAGSGQVEAGSSSSTVQ